MGIYNTENRYGSVTQFFHWLVALLFIAQILMGIVMSWMPRVPLKFQIYTVHKSIGIIVVFVTAAFIIWSLRNLKPAWPNSMTKQERFAARVGHCGLYCLLLIMSLSGWTMATASGHIPLFLGWFPAPLPGIPVNRELSQCAANIHYYAAWLSGIWAAVHIAAAIKHHKVDGNDVLKRMLPRWVLERMK